MPFAFRLTPLNSTSISVWIKSTPSNPERKSKCHHLRRNSPSVTTFSPASFCFSTSFIISSSSILRNSSAVISPFSFWKRACLQAFWSQKAPDVICFKWCFRSMFVLGCQICHVKSLLSNSYYSKLLVLRLQLLSACSKSAIKSSTCSSPTEKRNRPSVIPRFSRSSFGMAAWDIVEQDRKGLIRLLQGLQRIQGFGHFQQMLLLLL